MKHFIILLCLLAWLLCPGASAKEPVKIYQGNSHHVVAIFDGEFLYRGYSTAHSDAIFRFSGNAAYRGASVYRSDILFTIRNNIIYSGPVCYESSRVATLQGNRLCGKRSGDVLFHYSEDLPLIVKIVLLSP